MSSDEEETSRAMAEKIQAAVQAEVQTVLAQMNPPASSATSTIPPCQHPQPQLYPTRVSCRISVVFFFSDHPCVGLSFPSQADWKHRSRHYVTVTYIYANMLPPQQPLMALVSSVI